MTKQIPLPFNFGNIFISIFLNVSDIKIEEDLDIDGSKNFDTSE